MDPQNSQQEDAPTVMVSGILMRMAEVGRRRVLIASTRARHRGPWCRRWMPGPKMGTQCWGVSRQRSGEAECSLPLLPRINPARRRWLAWGRVHRTVCGGSRQTDTFRGMDYERWTWMWSPFLIIIISMDIISMDWRETLGRPALQRACPARDADDGRKPHGTVAILNVFFTSWRRADRQTANRIYGVSVPWSRLRKHQIARCENASPGQTAWSDSPLSSVHYCYHGIGVRFSKTVLGPGLRCSPKAKAPVSGRRHPGVRLWKNSGESPSPKSSNCIALYELDGLSFWEYHYFLCLSKGLPRVTLGGNILPLPYLQVHLWHRCWPTVIFSGSA